MTAQIAKLRSRYCLPLNLAVFGVILAGTVVDGAWFADRVAGGHAAAKKIMTVERLSVGMDTVHEQRVRFAADHGVADPAALAAAVRHSPLANLLISVAIEESLGDPVAIGAAGEQGAWQVKPSAWGLVPKDLYGQAGQAERIIRGLLINSKGDKIKALARYNGGTAPPGKSYRYAQRILKRARHLQVAENYLPPSGALLAAFGNS